MKSAIGFRATPNEIYYCITYQQDDEFEIKILDKVVVPAALIFPEQLKFVRSTFLDILNEFDVKLACLRITEPAAQNPHLKRISIEAVIQEMLASSSVQSYFTGQISSISSKLGFDRSEFKPLVAGIKVFSDLENWEAFESEERESILACFSALNL